jgi:protein-disulfide isomerase
MSAPFADQRRARLLRLGLVLALAVVVVVIVIVLSAGGGQNAATTPAPAGGSATPASTSLFDGIPQHGVVLGKPSAPATLIELADLQCPFCAEYTVKTMPTVVRDYVRTGKLRYELRLEAFLGPDSVRAAGAAAAATRANRLYQFADAVYHHQGAENSGYVTDAFLRQVADASGVNAGAALSQAGSSFASGRLNRANADAAKLGINSTPTLTVRRGNGPEQVLSANALDPASVAAALNKELAR